MNTKKNWLKSLAVAAVVSMAAANALAGGVVSAVTASGTVPLSDAPIPVAGMVTPSFNHPGGQLVATFSADCYVNSIFNGDIAYVSVEIYARDATGNAILLSPSGQASPFCSTNRANDAIRGSFATTRVGTLPPGTYHLDLRARTSNRKAGGTLGNRSLVVFR